MNAFQLISTVNFFNLLNLPFLSRSHPGNVKKDIIVYTIEICSFIDWSSLTGASQNPPIFKIQSKLFKNVISYTFSKNIFTYKT